MCFLSFFCIVWLGSVWGLALGRFEWGCLPSSEGTLQQKTLCLPFPMHLLLDLPSLCVYTLSLVAVCECSYPSVGPLMLDEWKASVDLIPGLQWTLEAYVYLVGRLLCQVHVSNCGPGVNCAPVPHIVCPGRLHWVMYFFFGGHLDCVHPTFSPLI